MALVELSFPARPAHVRTARQVAVTLARRADVDEAVLDEIRLAVGEACGLALSLSARSGRDDRVVIVFDDGDGLAVELHASAPLDPATGDAALKVVADAATARPDVVDELPAGVALAVLAELAPSLAVSTSALGMHLTLGWPRVPISYG